MQDTLFYGNKKFEREVVEMLEPARMDAFRLERTEVMAEEVFCRAETIEHLQTHTVRYREMTHNRELAGELDKIQAAFVPSGYVPEGLSEPDQSGRNLEDQAQLIDRADFLKAIASHPDTQIIRGYEKTRELLHEVGSLDPRVNDGARGSRNLPIKAVLDTPGEANLIEKCFGVVWPVGVDLYSILREMYPSFHAKINMQIPLTVAERFSELLHDNVNSSKIAGLGQIAVNAQGRYLGIYPTGSINKDGVTIHGQFVAQDQVARKAIVYRVLVDAIEILTQYPEQVVIVIDYAGGTGNLSELFLRQVFAMQQSELKEKLLSRVRVVVLDTAQEQLNAGKRRFEKFGKRKDLEGIDKKVFWFCHDIADPLNGDLSRIFRETHDPLHPTRPVYIGMNAYTLGALDTMMRPNGRTWVRAMADESYRKCWKIYAVDFSSPMWRLNDFLRDTSEWGREYLRLVHGCPEPLDEQEKLPDIFAALVRQKVARSIETVADYLKAVPLAPGLASHYMTVWPHRDGHCAGYSVQEDGSLRKPGIISYAKRLGDLGSNIKYKSRVFVFFATDIGGLESDRRLWAFAPGRVADFLVATNERNSPHKK
jgi:hypothetical protein